MPSFFSPTSMACSTRALLRIPGTKRGGEGNRSEVIPLISQLTPELRVLARGPSQSGRGGMVTKLDAAEIAMKCGGVAVIANGSRSDTLPRIFAGESEGTVFLPSHRMKGKRRWLAYAAGVRGRVVVDAGAQRAISRGKASLLSSGVSARRKTVWSHGRRQHRQCRRQRVCSRHRQFRQRCVRLRSGSLHPRQYRSPGE